MATQYTHNILSDLQMFFHQAGSCQMEGITALYNYIMSFLTGILCVVTTALVIIIFFHIHGQRHIYQYKTEKNLDLLIEWLKYVQRWTHSTTLELVWTIIPTAILIAIAIPSFILLYSLDEIVDTQTVIKITAFQWYWKYEYPVISPYTTDTVNFSYLSYMLPTEDLTEENSLRLLEVDMPLVVPTNVNVKLIITSKDVIHSFAVPALGIKMDAVPGRLNQVTVHIYKPGIYFGQCSELCGVNHAFMPIALHAVDFNTFESFLLKGVYITEVQEGDFTMKELFELAMRAVAEYPSILNETDKDLSSKVEVEAVLPTGEVEKQTNDTIDEAVSGSFTVIPTPENEPEPRGRGKYIDEEGNVRYDISHIPEERIRQYLAVSDWITAHPEEWEEHCKKVECVIDPETGNKVCKPKVLSIPEFIDYLEFIEANRDTVISPDYYKEYLEAKEKNLTTMTLLEWNEHIKARLEMQNQNPTTPEVKKECIECKEKEKTENKNDN